jgi:DNA/RNA-binding domain of Phe-tRNA-synthetase-like protein
MKQFPAVSTNIPGVLSETDGLDIRIQLTGMKAGIVEAANVHVRSLDEQPAREINEACTRLRTLYTCDSLRQWEPIRAVRQMFRDWGMDPSKYRPSSEALTRRVVKGEALPSISNVVDAANLGAIEMGWPYGCYDYEKISGPIEIRNGKAGEQYEGIGRQMFRLEGRPVFSDIHGPFGSPVSDSTRTMVSKSTRKLLAIVCVPESSCGPIIEEAISKLAERMVLWCGASRVKTRIANSTSGHFLQPGPGMFSCAPIDEAIRE